MPIKCTCIINKVVATKTFWKYFPFSGGHTLGAAHRNASGFVGSWVQRQKQFSNQYFIDMFDSSLGWEMIQKGSRRNPLYQWVGIRYPRQRRLRFCNTLLFRLLVPINYSMLGIHQGTIFTLIFCT